MPLTITLHDSARQQPGPALAHMAFGTAPEQAISHPGLLPLSHAAAVESWGEHAPRDSGRQERITWHADEHCLFGHVTAPLGDDAAAPTRDLYRELLDFVAASKRFPHLLRIWNYLPHINAGDGDREHYRRFCIGRAQAFDERPYPPDELPAGTGIGLRTGNELLVYFIATPRPGRQIENPRQISAFDYPRQYSPRKPLFSRAVVWADADGARLIVSGTASIVGHSSRHAGDVQAQLAEIWQNLDSLRQQSGAGEPIALRVYIRHADDYPSVRAFLEQRLAPQVQTLYLLADICRTELLVEIEGVFAMPDDRASVFPDVQ